MSPRHVLIIGDFDHPDFVELAAWLAERAEVRCSPDAASAARVLSPAASLDLCLFVTARPGRFRQEDVETIHRAAPLARIAQVLGAWCEGEMRTGAPLAGVLRMYWHEWPARLGVWWAKSQGSEATLWRLPRTALAGERTLSAPLVKAATGRLIAMRAENAASFAAVSDALRTAGHSAVWVSPDQPWRVQGAAVLLWEGDVRRPAERQDLSRLVQSLRPAFTVAIVNFLRPADVRLARDAGASHVLAKPFLLADLLPYMNATLDSAAANADHGPP